MLYALRVWKRFGWSVCIDGSNTAVLKEEQSLIFSETANYWTSIINSGEGYALSSAFNNMNKVVVLAQNLVTADCWNIHISECLGVSRTFWCYTLRGSVWTIPVASERWKLGHDFHKMTAACIAPCRYSGDAYLIQHCSKTLSTDAAARNWLCHWRMVLLSAHAYWDINANGLLALIEGLHFSASQ